MLDPFAEEETSTQVGKRLIPSGDQAVDLGFKFKHLNKSPVLIQN